jgi:hypothetical protein
MTVFPLVTLTTKLIIACVGSPTVAYTYVYWFLDFGLGPGEVARQKLNNHMVFEGLSGNLSGPGEVGSKCRVNPDTITNKCK